MATTQGLYYNTVTPELIEILRLLIAEHLFDPFRLVGGPNLIVNMVRLISERLKDF